MRVSILMPACAAGMLIAGAATPARAHDPVAGSGGAMTGSHAEYHVKAAFLYNFLKFVEWPASTFGNPESPFVLCVLGHDPFEGALEETIRDRPVSGRSCLVRILADRRDLSGCHVVFASLFGEAEIAEVIQRASRLPVLTVGETDRFEQAGGIIRFVVEENRVRFVINAAAARRAGLRLSSRLLGIARSVTGQGGSRDAPMSPDE